MNREIKPLLDPCEDAEPGSSGETTPLHERSELAIALEKVVALEAACKVLTDELLEAREDLKLAQLVIADINRAGNTLAFGGGTAAGLNVGTSVSANTPTQSSEQGACNDS